MANQKKVTQTECCPVMNKKLLCEIMHFSYRLNYRPESPDFLQKFANFPVGIELKFTFTYKRCPGDLVQGDLVYTNTLLPGETVKLFTSDRRSKFTYDTSSASANRNVQSSEESLQAQQMSDTMFDFGSKDAGNSSYQNQAHVDGHGDAGIDILGFGGEANMSGNFNSSGSSQFARELTQHAESKHNESVMSTRKANSISVGESMSRTHAEGSSEDQYESSSREFKNPNQCHAVTFLFYQIDKTYTIDFTLDSITVRIYNKQSDNARVSANPFGNSNGVGILSTNVLATDPEAVAAGKVLTPSLLINRSGIAFTSPVNPGDTPLSKSVITAITNIVIKELVDEGLMKSDGSVSDTAKKQYGFQTSMALPTPGVMVKGCMDDCDICEPELQRAHELELQNRHLQNELLKKQIELLEKSREYRSYSPAPVATDN
ncbi:MAG TPA: hypothetical protein VG847_07170 [Chitinophagaceae bacterium]|nr:hypothetical protein [Chitinophagaceae bacterium]